MAPARAELLEDGLVAVRRRHDRDARVVLRRGPDHRRAADVDLLDELVERDPGPLGGGRERVEVDDNQLERRDRGGEELAAMVRQAPIGKHPGVNPRVERLDAAVEHLREAGHGGHVGDRQPGVAERSSGAARRDELEPERDETAAELDEPGLVGDGQQRAPRDREPLVGPRGVDRDAAATRLD